MAINPTKRGFSRIVKLPQRTASLRTIPLPTQTPRVPVPSTKRFIAPPPKVRITPAKRSIPISVPPIRLPMPVRTTRQVAGGARIITTPGRPSTTEDLSAIRSIHNSKVGHILGIIGCGPSRAEAELNRLFNVAKVDLMTINRPLAGVWPTQYWLFCDNNQVERQKHLWDTYTGTIINPTSVRYRKNNSVMIQNIPGGGFGLDMTKGLHIGKSSVYAAMQVGLWMRYDHIYIFGCDMSAVNGKVYAEGVNPDVNDTERIRRFKDEAASYTWAGNNLPQDLRDKITFCSSYLSWPFVSKFNQLDHKLAVDIILKHIVGDNNGR